MDRGNERKARDNTISRLTWKCLPCLLVVCVGQTAWASPERYSEEPIEVPICTVNVLKTQKHKKLIEYVFQNAQQSKNTSPFWFAGTPLREDYCKVGSRYRNSLYEADDVVVSGKNDLVVWDEAGNIRVVGSYDEKGEKTGIWRSYHANGYLSTERKIKTYADGDSSLTEWDDEGDYRSQRYYDTEFDKYLNQRIAPQIQDICDVRVLKRENGIQLVEYVYQNPQKSKNTTPFWNRKTVLKQTYCLDAAWGMPVSYALISIPYLVRGSQFKVWDKQGHKIVEGNYEKFGGREGIWRTYYTNGQLRSQYNGRSAGEDEYWYATGQAKMSRNRNIWLTDKISIYPDLQIRIQRADIKGRQVSRMYDKNDKLILEVIRDENQRGKIISRQEFK